MQTNIANNPFTNFGLKRVEPKKTGLYLTALRYLKEMNFSVIPVGKDKRPLIKWQEYQKRLPTETELQGWFETWPDANIGIVTGVVSNLAVIDLDEVDIAKEALEPLIPDSLTFPVALTPSGGEHWYFSCADPTLSNNAKVIAGADLRANGGYIVAPPSINAEGKAWAWMPAIDCFSVKLPPLPDAYIQAIKKPAVINERPNSVKELLAEGAKEGSRNESLARCAGALFQKGLNHDEALRLCIAWNQTLEQPLPLGELEKTVESISKRHSKEETIQTGMPLIRLSDLLKEPDEKVDWLVERTLPAGGFSVIAAKPKVGKSTIARNLAFSISKGEPFLDKPVSKGSVIYYALEEKKSEVKKHFQDMGADGTEDIFIYTGGTPVDAIQQIKKVVLEIKPVLIIIDPLFRLTKIKDGNDYAQVTMALEPLLRLARDTGTHVLCVHHSGKGDRQGGDSVLGSTAIFGSVDTLLIMKRHEEYRTILSIQRYGEDLPETTLHFDKVGRTVEIGKPKQEEDIDGLKKAIMEFLSSQSEPVIKSVIMEEVEGRAVLKRKALMELVKNEQITREGIGGKGDPYKYGMSLCPIYSRDTPKQNPENGITVDNHNTNGMSQDFTENQGNEKSRDTAFSPKKGDVIEIDFEVVE